MRAWQRDGLLGAEQAAAILARYPADAGGESVRRRFVATLTVLGAVLVGVGVILFFAANWPRLPVAVRVGAIYLAVTASYAGGYHLAHVRRSHPRTGEALILLGALLFGAGVWLVAQIFHLGGHYPDAMLYWALGALLTAYAAASTPTAVLSALLLGIWTAMEQADFDADNYLFPAIAVGFGLPLARRQRSTLAGALYLLTPAMWAAINLVRWLDLPERGEVVAASAALLLLGAAYLAWSAARAAASGDPVRGGRGTLPLPAMGLLLGLAACYGLTFGWRDAGGRAAGLPLGAAVLADPRAASTFAVVAAVVAAGLAVAHARYWAARRRGDAPHPNVAVLAAVAAWLASSAVLLFAPPLQPWRPLYFNLALVALVLAALAAGYRSRSLAFVNLGLAFFALEVVTRYFDLFWSLLDRSAFFIGGGLLLMATGVALERGRRLVRESGAPGPTRGGGEG